MAIRLKRAGAPRAEPGAAKARGEVTCFTSRLQGAGASELLTGGGGARLSLVTERFRWQQRQPGGLGDTRGLGPRLSLKETGLWGREEPQATWETRRGLTASGTAEAGLAGQEDLPVGMKTAAAEGISDGRRQLATSGINECASSPPLSVPCPLWAPEHVALAKSELSAA